MSENKALQSKARTTLGRAVKLGADGVRVTASRSRNTSVTYRKGRPDVVKESARKGLVVDLYIDGRYTSCATNDLREAAVQRFLETSVAMCRAMVPDPYRTLPDPKLYAGRRQEDLEVTDPSVAQVRPKDRHEYAALLEAATLDAAGKSAISAEASYSDQQTSIFQIHSDGFQGSKEATQFHAGSEVTLQDAGDRRPAGWSQARARFRRDLATPEEIGKLAAKSAKDKLGAEKIKSEKLPMIVENRTVGGLLRHLLSATSGRALQQKRSFLLGCRGQKIGSPQLGLLDDPFVPRGFGSRLFDAEGIAAKKLPVVAEGVLENFYIDTYYGKKMDTTPTTAGSSNLVVTPGTKTLQQLVADIERGVLVRGFLGGNSNTTTGDFSLGVYGTLIERGKLTHAVAEINIAGNHKDLWRRLIAVDNDPYPYSSWLTPSLVFEETQFSGT